MNSTELYILAGEAIAGWIREHNDACVLGIQDGNVICTKPPVANNLRNDPLYISKFEISRGMKQDRWTTIGTALHNLYCRELACQEHQKP